LNNAASNIVYQGTQLGLKQPLDADLTAIAALTPANDDVLQRKSGSWLNRTLAQLKTDLAITLSSLLPTQTGQSGKFLSTDGTNASWGTPAGGGGGETGIGPVTVSGTPTSGQVPTALTGTTASWATPSSGFANPLTTKGDLIIRDATVTTRLPIGTNNQVLTVDSTLTAGVKWATPSLVPPIQFSAQTPVVGGTGSDEAQQARTLTGAKMRVVSAPAGSALTVQVQHSSTSGASWTDVGSALTIVAGSTTAVSVTFSQAQTAGHLVRLNVTSIGSTTAAGGVTVDVFRSVA
jgi:hypothetical protein